MGENKEDYLGLFSVDFNKSSGLNSEIYHSSINIPNFSISKITESKFHFLCEECLNIPEITFFTNNKIKYKCQCKQLELTKEKIYEIYDSLLYSGKGNENINKLKCNEHQKEFFAFCMVCKKNICNKCLENCNKHNIKVLKSDINIYKKIIYINEKLKEKNSISATFESSDTENNNNSCCKSIEMSSSKKKSEIDNKNENNKSNSEDNNFIVEKKNTNEINKEEFMKNMKEANEKMNKEEEEENYFYLISIIIDDYQNYPNYAHYKTISKLEKFISFYFHDYNFEIRKIYIFLFS